MAWEVCMAGGHAWQGVCVTGETATVAGGTHPTGMHSCYLVRLSTNLIQIVLNDVHNNA